VVFLVSPWDFLREPAVVISMFQPYLSWIVLIVAGVLLGIAVMAYKKNKSKAILWVSVGFAFFCLKAFIAIIDFYASPGAFFNSALQSFFDLIVLGCLFLALFRK
jgi:hypothetical protein